MKANKLYGRTLLFLALIFPGGASHFRISANTRFFTLNFNYWFFLSAKLSLPIAEYSSRENIDLTSSFLLAQTPSGMRETRCFIVLKALITDALLGFASAGGVISTFSRVKDAQVGCTL